MNMHFNRAPNGMAPELMRLAKLCEARGMPFLCQVEYAHGETSETKAVPAGAGIKTIVAKAGMECHGNVDALFIGLKRYADKHGHSSMVLRMMDGVTTPSGEVKPT